MATSTRGNLSIKEVMDTLQKSGATGGSAFDMGQNKMGVEQGVTNTLTQQANPALAKNKANYLAQIGKIAEMDQKLAGVYGDPTSPLYIERASTRDKAANMAEPANYSAANTQVDLYNQKKKTLEDSISQVLSVYDELTSLTKAQEVQDKKDAAAAKKGSGAGSKKLTKDQINAGVYDYAAANYWTKLKGNQADAFRSQWIRKVLSGNATPPDGGYTIDDIDYRWEAWKKAHPEKKAKTSAIDAIIDKAMGN